MGERGIFIDELGNFIDVDRLGEILVGNLDVIFFLELRDDADDREAVSAKIDDKVRPFAHFLFGQDEHVCKNFADFLFDLQKPRVFNFAFHSRFLAHLPKRCIDRAALPAPILHEFFELLALYLDAVCQRHRRIRDEHFFHLFIHGQIAVYFRDAQRCGSKIRTRDVVFHF